MKFKAVSIQWILKLMQWMGGALSRVFAPTKIPSSYDYFYPQMDADVFEKHWRFYPRDRGLERMSLL